MKKLTALAFLVLGACSQGYPADQVCEERDVRTGYCVKATFNCDRWGQGRTTLVFDRGEARCM